MLSSDPLASIGNVSGQVFYPVDHLLYLFDHGVLVPSEATKSRCSNISLLTWLISSLVTIITNLSALSGENAQTRTEKKKQRIRAISTFRFALDAILAYHWLPKPASFQLKLNSSSTAFIGVLSSILALYVTIEMKKQSLILKSRTKPPTAVQ